MKNHINNKTVLINIILYIIVFQSLLERVWKGFSYIDEFIALMTFSFAVIYAVRKLIISNNKAFFIMVVAILLYLVLGMLSSLIWQYQSIFISLTGAFLSIKWFLLMVGGYAIYSKYLNEDCLWRFKKAVYSLIAIFIVWVVASKLGFMYEYFIYPWDQCAKSVFLIAIILATWSGMKGDWCSIICLSLSLVLSNKAKGYAAVVIVAGCLFWIIINNKKIKIIELVGLTIIIFMVAWDKIYMYYVRGRIGDFARYRMFRTSIDIANDYFPLGTGWSTYGSYYSAVVYSPVYYLYGIDKHPELGVVNKWFLNDNYWPCVIAETGWLGMLAIVFFCIVLFVTIQRMYRVNKKYYAAAMVIFLYMMVTTVEETGFAQPVLACLGLALGTIMAAGIKTRETKNEITNAIDFIDYLQR